MRVLVGNAEPVVELTVTTPTSPFQFGQTVTYTVRSPTTRRSTARRSPWPTCSATRPTATRSPRPRAAPVRSRWPLDSGHAGASNLSAVFVASYTDPGEDGTPGLTGTDEVRLVPGEPAPTPPAAP